MTSPNRLEGVHPKALAVNRHVGSRIRRRRRIVGITQRRLAELIGVTYQQAHNYEKGPSRIPAGQLHAIARALETDVAFFFEQIDSGPIEVDRLEVDHRLVELTNDVIRISNPEHRYALCALARALATISNQQLEELA